MVALFRCHMVVQLRNGGNLHKGSSPVEDEDSLTTRTVDDLIGFLDSHDVDSA